MALPKARTRCVVRLSLGRWTTTDDITHAADLLAAAIRQADRAAGRINST